MEPSTLILASSSPRRSELLRTLGRDFTVLPSEAEESVNEHLTARELSQLNAYRKARLIAKRCPDALVIGADTVVHLDEVFYGKPASREEAHRFLRELQGRTHQVVTGVCLIHLRHHRQRIFATSTDVTFRALDDGQIREYLRRINPLDKAGAYGIQEFGDLIVQAITGSYTNVVGLPLEPLREELATFYPAAA